MLMANTNTTSRVVVTMPDGTVIEAAPEDLTAAIVSVHRADDAMSITSAVREPRVRRSQGLDPSANQHPTAARWTAAAVRDLLAMVTEAAGTLLRTAATMSEPVTVTAISTKLKTRAGGTGPLLAKLSRDAQTLAPSLPAPVHTTGKIGHKVLVFDPTFFEALKEVATH